MVARLFWEQEVASSTLATPTIYKKRMHLIQNIKWNGRSYSLEKHVSDHRQAVDDIKECSAHVTISLPDDAQLVEYLIDSIACS